MIPIWGDDTKDMHLKLKVLNLSANHALLGLIAKTTETR